VVERTSVLAARSVKRPDSRSRPFRASQMQAPAKPSRSGMTAGRTGILGHESDVLGDESDKMARHYAGEARKFAAATLMTKYSRAG